VVIGGSTSLFLSDIFFIVSELLRIVIGIFFMWCSRKWIIDQIIFAGETIRSCSTGSFDSPTGQESLFNTVTQP